MKTNLNLDLNLDLKMKFSKLQKYVFTLQSKRSLQTYCSLDLPAITKRAPVKSRISYRISKYTLYKKLICF